MAIISFEGVTWSEIDLRRPDTLAIEPKRHEITSLLLSPTGQKNGQDHEAVRFSRRTTGT